MNVFLAKLLFLILPFYQYVPTIPATPTSGGGGGITGTFHSQQGCTTGGASCAMTGIAVTAGDLAVCVVGSNETGLADTFSCTDSNSDSLTACSGPTSVGSTAHAESFCGTMGTTNAAEVFTPTRTGGTANDMAGAVIVITPSATPAVDKNAPGTYTATTAIVTGTTGTTTTASEIAAAVTCAQNNATVGGAWTVGSGWSNFFWTSNGTSGQIDCAVEWKQLSATGTVQGTMTSPVSETGVGFAVTFN